MLRATVQYEGTAFAGFQAQADARTVQGTLEAALERLTGAATRVTGAGRTDAGVHARGQVVSFPTATQLDPATLFRALNAVLPDDIVLTALEEAAPEFNARYEARSRAYEYVVYNAPLASPFWRHYSHHVPTPLDVASMSVAVEGLVGEHDFASFGMPMERTREGQTVRGGTIRTLFAARCRQEQSFVYFYLEANAFCGIWSGKSSEPCSASAWGA